MMMVKSRQYSGRSSPARNLHADILQQITHSCTGGDATYGMFPPVPASLAESAA
jgi:hypothetical protein